MTYQGLSSVVPKSLVNTTTELLHGLFESGNNVVWEEFDRRYRPILFGFLRKSGLSETDAADVAQDTMACFVQDYREHKYDRAQGRLRSWLIGIARCRLADRHRAVARRREARGESAIEVLPDDPQAEKIWEAEQQRYIFDQAIAELHKTAKFSEKTIEAFERVVLRHAPVATVSRELELSAQEIYNAKNRVVERLREIVRRYEEEKIG